MKVTPEMLTEAHVERLLEQSNGDDLARYQRLAICMEVEREPLATGAAQKICDAINGRKAMRARGGL